MLIPGYKGYKKWTKSKGYDTENETFTKYGKEIKIHDFIQAGVDGTIAGELVKAAGGLKQLKGAMEKIPTADFKIDLNMDPIMANNLLKAAKTAKVELERQTKMNEELAKIEQEMKAEQQNQNKGE